MLITWKSLLQIKVTNNTVKVCLWKSAVLLTVRITSGVTKFPKHGAAHVTFIVSNVFETASLSFLIVPLRLYED